ncbi:MAG TPA: histidine kinase dimerization/phosphoacceptor domain -containing protein [Skermanella sp.]|nr:histidine kinase dimerization/phosphoacceptor domain -containing protein [Skermanella sp.]
MKQRFHFMGLAATVLLPLLIFCSAMVYLFDRQQQEQIERLLVQTARSLSDAVDRQLTNHVSGLEALATSIHLDHDNLAGFSIEAERLLDSRAEWMSMRLWRAADAELLMTLFPQRVQDNVPSDQLPPSEAREQVRRVVASGKPEVSDLRQVAGVQPFVSVVVPVIRNGQVRYVLSANLRSGVLRSALAGPALPEGWIGSLLDRQRIILARSRLQDDFVGKPATESLRNEMNLAVNSFFFARSMEGHEVYGAFTSSPLSGWTVAVGAPAELAAAPQHRSRLVVFAGGLLSLAATLGLAALLLRNALRRQVMERRLAALERERIVERRLSDVAANLPGMIFRRVENADGSIRYPYVTLERGGSAPAPAGSEPGNGGDALAQLIHPEDRAAWAAAFTGPAGSEPSHLEVRAVPDERLGKGGGAGRVRWLRVMARPSPQPETGEGRAWDGVVLDVTDLKEIQDRLTAALEESQTLLGEVHHRVKNNLQVVWSLVQLEAMQIDHPAARARMEIIGQRINVMGRIHEQIYAHKEFTRIDFSLQLRALAERLINPLRRTQEIELEVTGERLFCSLDTAIPLALIANELVSNVAVHAFPPGRDGTVRIDLRHHENGAVMTVADDGVGLPEDGNGGKGLGMRLVKALIGQIDASMTVDVPEGLAPESSSKDNFDPGGGAGGTRVTIIVPGPWYAAD